MRDALHFKRGRNAPCWCGSGLKYKKCHLNREHQQPLDKWQATQSVKKEFSKKLCLAPKDHPQACEGKIINAHTVSKSACLKAIARNGQVYSFLPTLEKRMQAHDSRVEPELVGINKASTFTGFCKAHDTLLFSPVENNDFIGTRQQIGLLAYRTLTRELFGKTAYLDIRAVLREGDKGRSPHEQIELQNFVNDTSDGSSAALRDLIYQKQIFDSMVASGDFSGVEGFVIKFRQIPNIMCSSGLMPEFDFHGNILQDLLNLNARMSNIYINIVASNGAGYVVFSWLQSDADVCRRFIDSLQTIEGHRITDAIIRLVFQFFENRFANPDWWEALPDPKKVLLRERFRQSVALDTHYHYTCLIEDGVTYDDWGMESMGYID